MRRLILMCVCLILTLGLLGPAVLAQQADAPSDAAASVAADSVSAAPADGPSLAASAAITDTLVGIFNPRVSVSADWIKVSWITNVPASTQLRFCGTSSICASPTNMGDARGLTSSYTHYVTVQSLSPNTDYYFDIVSAAGAVTLVNNLNGNHWKATTLGVLPAPTAQPTPSWPNIHALGEVIDGDIISPVTKITDTLVYLRVQGSSGASEIAQAVPNPSTGQWRVDFPLRTADGSGYFSYTSNDTVWIYVDAGERGRTITQFMAGMLLGTNPTAVMISVLDSSRFQYSAVPVGIGFTLIGESLAPVNLAYSDFFTSTNGTDAASYFIEDLLRDIAGAPSASSPGANLGGPYLASSGMPCAVAISYVARALT